MAFAEVDIPNLPIPVARRPRGASILVAVSASTALAIRVAEVRGMTLVAIACGQDFENHSSEAN